MKERHGPAEAIDVGLRRVNVRLRVDYHSRNKSKRANTGKASEKNYLEAGEKISAPRDNFPAVAIFSPPKKKSNCFGICSSGLQVQRIWGRPPSMHLLV